MALDTYNSIWGKVLLRCPAASPLLARDWVTNAFRRVAERRPWSWLVKQSQFLTTAVYNTGTVAVTHNSTTVTGTGTAFTTAMRDRQFRISGSAIYSIDDVNAVAQTLTLDIAYGGTTAATATYEIFTAYGTVPSDFDYFISVWDPGYNWQLHLDITQRELNYWDAQRAYRGQSYVVAYRDHYTPYGETIPYARYEIWPHRISQYSYPFLYIARATDLQDSGATLPRYMRGDMLLEMALAEAARWPGSDEKKNPYYDLKLAVMHEQRAEFMINELERQDEERNTANLYYDIPDAWAPLDTDFWQKHAFPAP